MIADDFETIRHRMAEIEAEKKDIPAQDVPEEPKQIQHATYMGWDIHPPYTPRGPSYWSIESQVPTCKTVTIRR